MYDVLLIQANEFFSGAATQRNTIPTNLLYLASNLHNAGFKVKIYPILLEDLPPIPQDLPGLSLYFKSLAAALKNYSNVKYVGISCFGSSYYLASVIIAWAVREALPDATVIVGGYGPTVCPDDFVFENSPFDYILLGEADVALTELLLKLGNASGEVRQPGKYSTAQTIICPEIKDINSLPALNWSLLENIKMINSSLLFAPYYASRGCPFKCKYCCNLADIDELNYHEKWRPKSVERVIHELEDLNKYLGSNPRTIYFNDPIFGLKRTWKREFLAALTDLSGRWPNRAFWIEERVDTIDEEDIRSYSGFNMALSLGLESGSPRMLKLMNKTNHPKEYLEKMKSIRDMLEQYGVYYSLNIMGGYPGETKEEFTQTLDFTSALFKETKYGFPNVGKYCFFPGSYVYRNYQEPEFKETKIWVPDWYKRICNANLIAPMVDPSLNFNIVELYEIACKWAKPFFDDLRKRFTPIPKRERIYMQFKHFMLDRLVVGWDMRPKLFKMLAEKITDNMPELMPVDRSFLSFIENSGNIKNKHLDLMKEINREINLC